MKLRFNTFRLGLPNGLIFGFQTFAVMVVARNKDREGRRTGEEVKKLLTKNMHNSDPYNTHTRSYHLFSGFLERHGKLSKTVVSSVVPYNL